MLDTVGLDHFRFWSVQEQEQGWLAGSDTRNFALSAFKPPICNGLCCYHANCTFMHAEDSSIVLVHIELDIIRTSSRQPVQGPWCAHERRSAKTKDGSELSSHWTLLPI